jgi:prolipoprotein diacylglyceryltransferase
MSDFREIRALNKPYISSLSQHGILRPQDKHGRGVLEIRREDANATIYEMLLTVSYCMCICMLLTPWSRVLSEKLKCRKLLKKFPAFYGTRRFITEYTRARHLSLS